MQCPNLCFFALKQISAAAPARHSPQKPYVRYLYRDFRKPDFSKKKKQPLFSIALAFYSPNFLLLSVTPNI